MSTQLEALSPTLSPEHRVTLLGATITEIQEPLLPEEEPAIKKAVPKRIREYTASRTLARRAMSTLHQPTGPVLRSERRAPLWPNGLTGSLTHTDDHCACAMGLTDDIRSVGIDMEVIGRAAPNLWDRLFTPSELTVLAKSTTSDRDATLMFTAKEAFYKLQFPITTAWLGFTDVEVQILSQDSFKLTVRNQPENGDPLPSEILGVVSEPFAGTLLSQIWLPHA